MTDICQSYSRTCHYAEDCAGKLGEEVHWKNLTSCPDYMEAGHCHHCADDLAEREKSVLRDLCFVSFDFHAEIACLEEF